MNTTSKEAPSMLPVKLQVQNGHLRVHCPFNYGFVHGAKKLAGKWQGADKLWAFDARVEALVRALCIQWFGTDGNAIPDLVDVRLTYPTGKRCLQGPATAFGRVVGRASGRDTGARLGEGIVLVQGRVGSSGSWKNWETCIGPETVILMHDVPRSLVKSGSPDKAEVEIVPKEAHSHDVTQLKSERDRLVARVAEIDELVIAASAASMMRAKS